MQQNYLLNQNSWRVLTDWYRLVHLKITQHANQLTMAEMSQHLLKLARHNNLMTNQKKTDHKENVEMQRFDITSTGQVELLPVYH